MIIAHRPAILFFRDWPESLESEWSKYPVWQENTLLGRGRTSRSVYVSSLMADQDRYLVWRYEYVLAVIYDTPNPPLRPNALVPKDLAILMDRKWLDDRQAVLQGFSHVTRAKLNADYMPLEVKAALVFP